MDRKAIEVKEAKVELTKEEIEKIKSESTSPGGSILDLFRKAKYIVGFVPRNEDTNGQKSKKA
jgi:hypothetical protein